MTQNHISTRFDRNLNVLVSHVMALAGLVESQTRHAIRALLTADPEGAQAVLQLELLVDRMEVEIDRELCSAVGRRQPKAGELRLLTALTRATSNLERVGDEAERIARTAQSLARRPPAETGSLPAELGLAASLAAGQLHDALDALVRLDTAGAAAVLREDQALDREFARFVACMAMRMASEPRSVACGVDLVVAGKAIERIGDHAKNIAESIIYIVQGVDIRHAPHRPADAKPIVAR